MRRAAKKDRNHNEIARALRDAGVDVFESYQIGAGFPDLTCGRGGRTYLLEVKCGRGVLTPDEAAFLAGWRGHVAVVTSVDEALRAVGLL